MSRRHRLPTRQFHCLVFAEDLNWLETNFGLQSDRPIGVGNVIREIIHKRVQQIKAKIQDELDSSPATSHQPPATETSP